MWQCIDFYDTRAPCFISLEAFIFKHRRIDLDVYASHQLKVSVDLCREICTSADNSIQRERKPVINAISNLVWLYDNEYVNTTFLEWWGLNICAYDNSLLCKYFCFE